ncbi:hypothetical protein [Arsenicicoccus dermatophilus]|nr:hypothetical protein [Arsenicicoccus dermatophilus]
MGDEPKDMTDQGPDLQVPGRATGTPVGQIDTLATLVRTAQEQI